jgi:hypothetical protein
MHQQYAGEYRKADDRYAKDVKTGGKQNLDYRQE